MFFKRCLIHSININITIMRWSLCLMFYLELVSLRDSLIFFLTWLCIFTLQDQCRRGSYGILFCVWQTFDMNNQWLIGIPTLVGSFGNCWINNSCTPCFQNDIEWKLCIAEFFLSQLRDYFCQRYVREHVRELRVFLSLRKQQLYVCWNIKER